MTCLFVVALVVDLACSQAATVSVCANAATSQLFIRRTDRFGAARMCCNLSCCCRPSVSAAFAASACIPVRNQPRLCTSAEFAAPSACISVHAHSTPYGVVVSQHTQHVLLPSLLLELHFGCPGLTRSTIAAWLCLLGSCVLEAPVWCSSCCMSCCC